MASEQEDRYIVIGGSGGVGSAVVRLLAAEGRWVRAVNRSGKFSAPEGVEVLGADARDAEKMVLACRTGTVVFHCAHPRKDYGEFLPITANIIAGTEAAEAKLIMAASAYPYGKVDGPMTESLPNKPEGLSGAYHTQAADMVMAAHKEGRLSAAIGRASNYFGPNAPTMWPGINFIDALQGKRASVIGDLDAVHTYTYSDDFASALITLGDHAEALGGIWHVPSDEPVTTRQFLEDLYAEAGTQLSTQVGSRFVLSLLGIFNLEMRQALEVYYQFDRPFILDDSKFRKAFGAKATPIRTAIRTTVEYFRTHPVSSESKQE